MAHAVAGEKSNKIFWILKKGIYYNGLWRDMGGTLTTASD